MTRRRRKSPQTLLGILLCIPIAFIVYFAISYSSQNITPESVHSVSLTLPSGEQFTYDDSAQVTFFVNAMLDSKSISTPVRDVTNETPVTIQFDRGDKVLSYKLYPQLNLSGCMVLDADGSMFLMTTDTAQTLLVRPELQYLYNDYFLPALSVVSGTNSNEVLPVSYDWHYKKVDGNYYSDTMTLLYDVTNNNRNSIYPNLQNSLDFSVEPTELVCSYTTAAGEFVSDLSFLSFTDDTEITVSITAKWSELGGPDYYGEATYSFRILYDIPATVTLTQTDFSAGEIAVLNIQYLNENEQLAIETQLITSDLLCYTSNDSINTIALLPISMENTAGTYSLNFSVGGASYSNTINVTSPSTEAIPEFVTQETYDATLSETAVNETKERMATIFGQASCEAYYVFGQAFTAPVTNGILASFGSRYLISADSTTRTVLGTVYSTPDSTTVKAAQKGKVVFAESLPTTGNTLIIDHGFGVMSCYFNLKGFDCVVGDVVLQGEIVAYSGATGFTGDQSILDFAVAVNGVFVNPSEFLG